MQKMFILAVALAGAMASVVPSVDAAWLTAESPVQVAAGWIRIAGRYASDAGEPSFRAIARCGGDEADPQVLDGRVYVVPAEGALWVDLPGTPERLAPAGGPCDAPVLSLEMLVHATVVASAPVSRRELATNDLAAVLRMPRPSPARPAGRLSLKGQKYPAPYTKRTEAGVEWALDSHVSIQLNYARTAQAPMMPFDHDDGILTRLRVGF